MKKFFVKAGAGIAALCVMGAVLISCGNTGLKLKINGEPVGSEEYLYTMGQQVYAVTKELTAESGAMINNEFWIKEINGELPYKKLAEATIEQLRYNRAVYEVAREQGFVEQVDYPHMKARMEQENKIRKEKTEAGEAVYGLSEFSQELFMEYEMDTFQKEYCKNPENKGMTISQEERQQYYEEYKDVLFTKEDDMTIDYIKIDYEGMGFSQQQREAWKEEVTDLYKKMDREHSLKSLAEQNGRLKEYLKHQEILSGQAAVLEREIGDIIQYASPLQKGESTQVIDEYGALYLIECTDRTPYDYQPLEEVRENIDKELREQHYNEMIMERAREAEVQCTMEQVYDFTKKHIKK